MPRSINPHIPLDSIIKLSEESSVRTDVLLRSLHTLKKNTTELTILELRLVGYLINYLLKTLETTEDIHTLLGILDNITKNNPDLIKHINNESVFKKIRALLKSNLLSVHQISDLIKYLANLAPLQIHLVPREKTEKILKKFISNYYTKRKQDRSLKSDSKFLDAIVSYHSHIPSLLEDWEQETIKKLASIIVHVLTDAETRYLKGRIRELKLIISISLLSLNIAKLLHASKHNFSTARHDPSQSFSRFFSNFLGTIKVSTPIIPIENLTQLHYTYYYLTRRMKVDIDHTPPPIPRGLEQTVAPGDKLTADIMSCFSRRRVNYKQEHTLMGVFIVDFYLPKHRVVLEVDGGVHHLKQLQDEFKQAILESSGYTVFRIRTTAYDELLERTKGDWGSPLADWLSTIITPYQHELKDSSRPSHSSQLFDTRIHAQRPKDPHYDNGHVCKKRMF